jgi:hypothetical protein
LERGFSPTMPEVERARKLAAWRRAVKRMLFRPPELVPD